MPPTRAEATFWRQFELAFLEFLKSVGIVSQVTTAELLKPVKFLAESARNLTISAFEHWPLSQLRPLLVGNDLSYYTVLLTPGCETFSSDCIIRQFNSTEDLRSVTAIPYELPSFGATASHVNTDPWNLPILYIYNPITGGNFNDSLEVDNHGVPVINTAQLGSNPLTRHLYLPSSDKALALLDQPIVVKPIETTIQDSDIDSIFWGAVVLATLPFIIYWACPCFRPREKKSARAGLHAAIATARAEEKSQAVAQLKAVEQRELDLERAYTANIHSFDENLKETRGELQQTRTEKDTAESDLRRCESEKAEVKSELQQCKSDKETLEGQLQQCDSQKQLAEDKNLKLTETQEQVVARLKELEAQLRTANSAKEQAEINARQEAIASKETEIQLREELSVVEAKIKDLQPYKARATDLSNEVSQLQRDLSDEKEGRKEEIADLTEGHNEEVEGLKKEHREKIKSLMQDHTKALENVNQANDEVMESMEKEHNAEVEKLKQEHVEELKGKDDERIFEVEQLKYDHTEEVNSLNQAHSDDVDKLKEDHNEGVDSLETEHRGEVESLKRQVEGVKQDFQEALTSSKQLGEALDSSKKEHLEEVNSLKNDDATALESLQVDHLEEVNSLKQGHGAAVESLKANHLEEVSSLKNQHDAAMEGLQANHVEQISSLKEDHVESLESFKGNHIEEVSSLKKEHETASESLRVEHNQEIGRLNKAHDDTVLALKEEHRLQVWGLDCKIQSHKDTQAKLTSAGDDRADAEAKAEELRQQLKEAQSAVQGHETLKLENTRLANGNKALRDMVQQAKAEIETKSTDFEKEKGSLQAQLQDAQSEMHNKTSQHENTQNSLQEQLDEATNLKSQLECENAEALQKVITLEARTTSQANSIKAKDGSISEQKAEIQQMRRDYHGLKTELEAEKKALDEAKRTIDELKQSQTAPLPEREFVDKSQQTTPGEKKRNRRKLRNGQYNTDRSSETEAEQNDLNNEPSPKAQPKQLIQPPVAQSVDAPAANPVDKLAEGLESFWVTNKKASIRQAATPPASLAQPTASPDQDSPQSVKASDVVSSSKHRLFTTAPSDNSAQSPSNEGAGSIAESEISLERTSPTFAGAEERAHQQQQIEDGLKQLVKAPSSEVGVKGALDVTTASGMSKPHLNTTPTSAREPVKENALAEDSGVSEITDAAAVVVVVDAAAKPKARWASHRTTYRTPEEDRKSSVGDMKSFAKLSGETTEAASVPFPENWLHPYEHLDLSETNGHTVLPRLKRKVKTKEERLAHKANGEKTISETSSVTASVVSDDLPAPVANSAVPATPVQPSVGQTQNAAITTPIPGTMFHDPYCGRPKGVSEAEAARRDGEMWKSKWAHKDGSRSPATPPLSSKPKITKGVEAPLPPTKSTQKSEPAVRRPTRPNLSLQPTTAASQPAARSSSASCPAATSSTEVNLPPELAALPAWMLTMRRDAPIAPAQPAAGTTAKAPAGPAPAAPTPAGTSRAPPAPVIATSAAHTRAAPAFNPSAPIFKVSGPAFLSQPTNPTNASKTAPKPQPDHNLSKSKSTAKDEGTTGPRPAQKPEAKHDLHLSKYATATKPATSSSIANDLSASKYATNSKSLAASSSTSKPELKAEPRASTQTIDQGVPSTTIPSSKPEVKNRPLESSWVGDKAFSSTATTSNPKPKPGLNASMWANDEKAPTSVPQPTFSSRNNNNSWGRGRGSGRGTGRGTGRGRGKPRY